MPISPGYDPRKTRNKSFWEGVRTAGIVVAGALAAWGLSPEGSAFLTAAIPVKYALLLPLATALLRAIVDFTKHKNTPVKIDAQSIREARSRFEEGGG